MRWRQRGEDRLAAIVHNFGQNKAGNSREILEVTNHERQKQTEKTYTERRFLPSDSRSGAGVSFMVHQNATCDVVYSDYIRLVNSYLPDVYDPDRFFVP